MIVFGSNLHAIELEIDQYIRLIFGFHRDIGIAKTAKIGLSIC